MKSISILTLFTFILLGITSCNNGEKKGTESDESTEAPDMSSSEMSLDWDGIYYGTVPCADCDGIQTQIRLYEDGEYTKMTKYKGKDGGVFMEIGYFEWDDSGSNVILTSEEDEVSQYKVGEGNLTMLDLSGNKIEGGLADLYVLSKKYADFEDGKWRLVTLMGQDVEMTESGKNYPFIQFSSEDQRFFGSTGCNNFNGEYLVDKGMQIELSKVALTRKACKDMSIEAQFTSIINKTDNFSLGGNKLTLNKARMAPLAEFEPIYFD